MCNMGKCVRAKRIARTLVNDFTMKHQQLAAMHKYFMYWKTHEVQLCQNDLMNCRLIKQDDKRWEPYNVTSQHNINRTKLTSALVSTRPRCPLENHKENSHRCDYGHLGLLHGSKKSCRKWILQKMPLVALVFSSLLPIFRSGHLQKW